MTAPQVVGQVQGASAVAATAANHGALDALFSNGNPTGTAHPALTSDAAHAQALTANPSAVLSNFVSWGANGLSSSHTAAKAWSATTLAVSSRAVVAGRPVTLAATVHASTRPTGTVTFKDGAKVLGTAWLDGRGVARLTTYSLARGYHSITAVYNGDGHVLGSSSAADGVSVTAQSVPPSKPTAARAWSATTLAVSARAVLAGRPVTLTATVSSSAHPTGSVTFKDGAKVLGTAWLDGRGVARLTTYLLARGYNSITAVYNGDGHVLGSTSRADGVSVTAQSVPPSRPSATSTAWVTLQNVGNVSTAGSSLMFVVTVSPARGGTVTVRDGSTSLGQFEVDRTGKTAVAIPIGLSAGRHTLTASYVSADGTVKGTGSLSLSLAQSSIWE
jgi:hypothetical protein